MKNIPLLKTLGIDLSIVFSYLMNLNAKIKFQSDTYFSDYLFKKKQKKLLNSFFN